MKNRKLSALLVCLLIVVLALTGCKKSVGTPEDNPVKEETEEGEEQAETEEDVHTFGFSGIDMQNPYFITLENAVREAVEKEDATLITKDPKGDDKLQAAQLQEMIDEGVDAVFVSPVDWESITPSLQSLQEAGVKVINVDTQVKEMDYVDAYVGSDNKEAGHLCGESLKTALPNGGKVLILESPAQNSVNERITGFEEVISKADPGFEIVAREDTNGQFEKALELAKAELTAHPDINAIMCGNDQMAVAAQTAVNLLNMKDVVIYSVDGSPDIKKELLKGDTQIAGTAAQSPINIGKTAVELAFAILNEEEYEKETYVEIIDMITRENVEMYGADGWQ